MQVKLVLFKANGRRRDFDLSAAKTSIGRRDDCTLRIPLMGVSRRHCELTIKDRTLRVKDLGSSNGTYVNGRRVSDQPLKAGDKVSVGPITFIVQIDGMPADLQPPTKPSTPPAAKSSAGEEYVPDLSGDDVEISQLGSSEGTSGSISALDALLGGDDDDGKK